MDVGTVQNPVANITMPGQKAGTPVPATEIKTPAPMQVLQVQALPAIPTRVSETELAVRPLWLPERLAN